VSRRSKFVREPQISLQAFDLTLQQGTYEPSTLAPIARLFSAGDVRLASRTSPTGATTRQDRRRLGAVQSRAGGHWQAGELREGSGEHRTGPTTAARRGGARAVPERPVATPVAVIPGLGPASIYRAEPAIAPLVIDGSGAGVVAGQRGLLEDNPTIFYAASLDGDKKLLGEVVTPAAQLVLTDSNRKVLERWSSA